MVQNAYGKYPDLFLDSLEKEEAESLRKDRWKHNTLPELC